MERRKLLLGMGSVAAAGAAGLGTGAFNQVSAERTMTVGVADDSNALLTLDASAGPNSQYTTETDGTVEVNLSKLNINARTLVFGLFQVKNTGDDAAIVYVNPDSVFIDNVSVANGNTDDYIDPQATNRPNDSGAFTDRDPIGYDAVSLTAIYGSADGNELPDPPAFAAAADSRWDNGNGVDELRVGSGQAFQFGVYITEDGDGSFGDVSLELVADTSIA